MSARSRVVENVFVQRVRNEGKFDEQAYGDLVAALGDLQRELAGQPSIDKDLALLLYSIPLMVRNTFLAFEGDDGDEYASRLEDAWVDLDGLVAACLSG